MNQERRIGTSGQKVGFTEESIEATGRLWKKRREEKMMERKERTLLIVRDTSEYQQISSLPKLTGEIGPYGGVSYDALGNIYTFYWPEKKTKIAEDGKRYIPGEDLVNIRVLNRKRIRTDIFDDLPKSIKVRELVYRKVDSDVETAIRMQRHILKRFQLDPKEYGTESLTNEVELARKVIERTDKLAFMYIRGKVTEKDLLRLAEQTEVFLEDVGLLDPEDPDKMIMREQLLKASEKDILDRINPMVARVRARSAYLAASRRLIVGGMVVRKYATNEQILIYERENIRWTLKTASTRLESMLRHADFRRPDGDSTRKQRAAIANMLRTMSGEGGHLDIPKLKPYLLPARQVIVNLIGSPERGKRLNTRILGKVTASKLYEQIPVTILVIEGNFSEARDRMKQSIKVLDNTLKEHESIEK